MYNITFTLVVFDWVMKRSIADRHRGITWNSFGHLEDEDFADNIALLSHSYQDMQEKTSHIVIRRKKIYLSGIT